MTVSTVSHALLSCRPSLTISSAHAMSRVEYAILRPQRPSLLCSSRRSCRSVCGGKLNAQWWVLARLLSLVRRCSSGLGRPSADRLVVLSDLSFALHRLQPHSFRCSLRYRLHFFDHACSAIYSADVTEKNLLSSGRLRRRSRLGRLLPPPKCCLASFICSCNT